MLNLPERIKGISHPLVHDIYLKKDFGYGHRGERILVIETSRSNDNQPKKSFIDLLIDLQGIEYLAEQSVGRIDRVDIVSH